MGWSVPAAMKVQEASWMQGSFTIHLLPDQLHNLERHWTSFGT